jgi:hypothetical protein
MDAAWLGAVLEVALPVDVQLMRALGTAAIQKHPVPKGAVTMALTECVQLNRLGRQYDRHISQGAGLFASQKSSKSTCTV